MTPSGLTSTSSGSSGACSVAAASGEKVDSPSPWNDCDQSIGPSPSSYGGASGKGSPEVGGMGVRVSVDVGLVLLDEVAGFVVAGAAL